MCDFHQIIFQRLVFGDVKMLSKFKGYHPQQDKYLHVPWFCYLESSGKRILLLWPHQIIATYY